MLLEGLLVWSDDEIDQLLSISIIQVRFHEHPELLDDQHDRVLHYADQQDRLAGARRPDQDLDYDNDDQPNNQIQVEPEAGPKLLIFCELVELPVFKVLEDESVFEGVDARKVKDMDDEEYEIVGH